MSPNLDFLDAAGSRLKRWSLAAVFVVTMYASACALALVNWTEEETVEETRGAFLVEIADETVAPPAEKLNLAVGPPQEEVAAASAVAPTPTTAEKSDIETPKIEEAPLAPKPEVVVQKQQPVEKPDEKEVKEDPRPQQVNVEQASAAPQHAKAPPPTEAPTAAVAAAPKAGHLVEAFGSQPHLAEGRGAASQQAQDLSRRGARARRRRRRHGLDHHRPLGQGHFRPSAEDLRLPTARQGSRRSRLACEPAAQAPG